MQLEAKYFCVPEETRGKEGGKEETRRDCHIVYDRERKGATGEEESKGRR